MNNEFDSVIGMLYSLNPVGCGPHRHSYKSYHRCPPIKFLNEVTNQHAPGGIPYIQPGNSFHPQAKIFIDFTHQFTFEKYGGKRPLSKESFKEYAVNLYNFVTYYFDYALSYNGKMAEAYDELRRRYWGIDWGNEDNMCLFVNVVLNYFITDITVDRTRNEIGNASVSFRDNLNIINGKKHSLLFNYTHSIFEQLFSPMLPIQIYAKGRMYTEWWFPIFDGYLTSNTPTNSNGFTTMSINCKDILELARTSTVNVSPSILISSELEKSGGMNLYGMPFYGKDHFEIFRLMFTGGFLNETIEFTELAPLNFLSEEGTPTGGIIDNEENKAIHRDSFSLDAMQKRTLKNKKRSVVIWGQNITPYRTWALDSPKVVSSNFSGRLDILKQVAEMCYYDFYVDGSGDVHYNPRRYMNDYLAYDMIFDTKRTDVHAHTFPGAQVVGLEETTSKSSTFNIEELITFLHLEGSEEVIEDSALNRLLTGNDGSAKNNELMKRYGYRRGSASNQLFLQNFKVVGNITFLDLVALALLHLQNAELYTKQQSIIFRPEFEIALPCCFIDDETVFYVNSISHTITIGSEATTNINASFGRKLYEKPLDLQSMVLFSEKMFTTRINPSLAAADQIEMVKQIPAKEWVNAFDYDLYVMGQLEKKLSEDRIAMLQSAPGVGRTPGGDLLYQDPNSIITGTTAKESSVFTNQKEGMKK